MTSQPIREFLEDPAWPNPAVQGHLVSPDIAPSGKGGLPVIYVMYPSAVINGVHVVAAPAEIDVTNAEALRSALVKAAANGHSTVVVDMTRTQFCDSSGLHTLIAAHRRARAERREVLLVIPCLAVLRVFAVTGVDTVIPNFTCLDEALAAASRLDDAGTAEATLAGEPCC